MLGHHEKSEAPKLGESPGHTGTPCVGLPLTSLSFEALQLQVPDTQVKMLPDDSRPPAAVLSPAFP